MEKKEDNDNNNDEMKNNTSALKPMKMQDFFRLSDNIKFKKNNQNEDKKNKNNEKEINSESNNKNNLYKFLYESAKETEDEITNQIISIKKEQKKKSLLYQMLI